VLFVLLTLLPLLGVVGLALAPISPDAQEFLTSALPRYMQGTGVVMLTAVGTALLLGVAPAWLTTVCQFPGRGVLAVLMVLPLAAPGYVLSYAWSAMLAPGGLLASLGGAGAGLANTELGRAGLAGLVIGSALFPYVFIAAKAGFTAQSVCALEAARLAGAGPWRCFLAIGLAGARPAVVAGAALVAMEAAADYGTVGYLGVDTLTTGIMRAWAAFADVAAAAQIGLGLAGLVAVLVWLERAGRGARGYAASSARWRTLPGYRLSRGQGFAAGGLLGLIVCVTLVLPLLQLGLLLAEAGWPRRAFWAALGQTIGLAGAGAMLTVVVATALAVALGRQATGLRVAVATGYALPGIVTAVGGLSVISLLAASLPPSTHFYTALSLAGLLWVYVTRFAEAGLSQIEAARARVPERVEAAARLLEPRALVRWGRVAAPLWAPGLLAGGLVVAVEIIKELPATLLLRPFGVETLATRAHAYAADESLGLAAAPALVIVAIGLVPAFVFTRLLPNSRPGSTRLADQAAGE
jgi:iron(III) transport system permease protein